MGFKMWHIYTVEYQSVINKNKNTDGTAEDQAQTHKSIWSHLYDPQTVQLERSIVDCRLWEGEQSEEKGRWEQGRLVGTKLHYLEASSSV